MKPFAASSGGDGGGFDGAPPTEAQEGLYYGACLSQLAFGRLDRVFSFYSKSKFTPDPAGGGKLILTLQALALEPGGPGTDRRPTTVEQAKTIGGTMTSPDPATPNVQGSGKYSVELGTVTVPGEANPITGREVIIEQAKLNGLYASERFCAQLNGNVIQPVQLTLSPDQNICQFVKVEEGAARPELTAADFTASACPY